MSKHEEEKTSSWRSVMEKWNVGVLVVQSGFICSVCGHDAGMAVVIKGKIYCGKCGEIQTGIRDKSGKNEGG